MGNPCFRTTDVGEAGDLPDCKRANVIHGKLKKKTNKQKWNPHKWRREENANDL